MPRGRGRDGHTSLPVRFHRSESEPQRRARWCVGAFCRSSTTHRLQEETPGRRLSRARSLAPIVTRLNGGSKNRIGWFWRFFDGNNSSAKWFCGVEGGGDDRVAGGDVHFFLDFRSKEPYI